MDGPTIAEGWDTTEISDSAIYRAVSLAWNDKEGIHWDGRQIVDCATKKRVEDSSLNSIMVTGTIERVHDIIGFWHELYRVCAHAAQVTVSGPYWSCVDSLADPTRVRGLSEQMFVYLSAPSRVWMAKEVGEDGYALRLLDGLDFEPTRYVRITGQEWEARSDEAKSWGLTHNNNVCRRLEVALQAYKPTRKLD